MALSALQVLLTADQGRENNANGLLRGISLGIGTASIIGGVGAVLVMAALFSVLRFVNEAFAKSKKIDSKESFPLNASWLENSKIN